MTLITTNIYKTNKLHDLQMSPWVLEVFNKRCLFSYWCTPDPSQRCGRDNSPYFFGTMRLFLKLFGLLQRVNLLFFNILQHNGCQKIPKGPPFTFFWHCDTVQKSQFSIFLGNFFKSPKGSPSIFFHILQPAGVSQSPKGPPFTILSLRYSADFGRSMAVTILPSCTKKIVLPRFEIISICL